MNQPIKFNLTLVRPAKSKGGDRYESPIEGSDKPLVIYLPQEYTRAGGEQVSIFRMTLEPVA